MEKHASDSAGALIDQWYREYYQSIYQYIRCRLRCSHEEAEDLTEEVYERAYYSLKGQSEPIDYPRNWLRKFADNVCSEFRTVSHHYPVYRPASYTTFDGEEGSPLEDLESRPGDQPEHITEQREALRLVHDILETLPPEQRQAVLLHRMDGYTFDQIATMYPDRAARTIRQDAQKGMKNLKVRLNQLEY
jgi:RNA polymerase sigma factor (sigma-70 family)